MADSYRVIDGKDRKIQGEVIIPAVEVCPDCEGTGHQGSHSSLPCPTCDGHAARPITLTVDALRGLLTVAGEKETPHG